MSLARDRAGGSSGPMSGSGAGLGAGEESSRAMSWEPSPGVVQCIMNNCRRGFWTE